MSVRSAIRNPPSAIILAVTGASGGPYALRVLDALESAGREVHLVVSPMGRRLLADECGIKTLEPEALIGRGSDRVHLHAYRDVGSPLASGSYLTGGMVICPCTSNTLGAVASGLGDNLITRAAHVTLKESRRLILVPREMPLSAIDLENMLKLQRAGAVICPAAPGFYLRPRTIDDLVDFVAGKVLDLLGVEHALKTRWGERPAATGPRTARATRVEPAPLRPRGRPTAGSDASAKPRSGSRWIGGPPPRPGKEPAE